MSDKNIELALLIRADLQQAIAALRELEGGLGGVAGAGEGAAKSLDGVDTGGLDAAAKAAGQAAPAIEGIAAAADAAAAGLRREAETAEEAEQRIRAMVQASLERKRAMEEQRAAEQELAESVRGTAEVDRERVEQMREVNRAAYESQAAITAQMRSIGELQQRVEAGARSLEDLHDIEQMLDRMMQAGLVTHEEQIEVLRKLDQQEKQLLATQQRQEKQVQSLLRVYDPASAALAKLATDEARLKAAVDQGRISREQYNRAMVGIAAQRAQWELVSEGVERVNRNLQGLNLTAREARRSLASAATALMRGDVSGAGNSLLNLGSRGALSFGLLGAAIGGTVAALGLFAKAAWEGYQQSQRLDRMIIATGGSLGMTRGELESMGRSIDGAVNKIGQGRVALELLGNTGEATAETLEAAGRAAVALSELTGQKIEQTTATVQRLMQEPAKYSAELNRQYNYLTAEIYNQIRALEAQGRTTDAVKLAVETFSDSAVNRLREVEQNLGFLESAWRGVGNVAKWAWDRMLDIGRSSTLEDQLAAARNELATLGRADRMATEYGRVRDLPEQRERILEKIRGLEAQIASEREKADKAEADATANRLAIEAEGRQSAALGQDRAIAKANELKQLEADIAALRARNIDKVDGRSLAELEAQRRKQIEEKYAERAAGGGRGGRGGLSDAQRAEQAAQRELENLTRQAALLGELEAGERRLSEEARVRYETTAGGYRLASEALKQQLLEQARALDAARAAQEAEEERLRTLKQTEQAYERLRAALMTPAEAAVADAIEKIEVLNAALKEGPDAAAEYREALNRIVNGLGPAPMLDRSWEDLTGLGFEQRRLDEFAQQLREHFEVRAQIIAEGRARGQEEEEFWRQQELQLEAEHQDRLQDLQRARQQLAISSTQSIFDSMATIAKNAAGEQSRAYQVLFAISKGFAVAQAAVALAENVAKASKAGYPQNLPLIAAAFAQGAQISSLLAAANYSPGRYATGGRIHGPGTGTSDSIPIYASNGEFMVRERSVSQPGALSFLEEFNRRGMAALRDWRGFAEGGLIAHEPFTAANLPRLQAPERGASETVLQNRMDFYFYTNLEQALQAMLNSPAVERRFVEIAGQNGNAIRAEWEA